MRIGNVTAWAAFVESGGNLDAAVGKHIFRTNLTRVLVYIFKPWPPAYGARRVGDVLEDGFFAGTAFSSATAATPLA